MAKRGRPRNDETTSNIAEQETALMGDQPSFSGKSLQKRMQGESIDAYNAYLERRDSADMTISRFCETIYSGDATPATVATWASSFRWADRIVDYRRPITQKIAESVTRMRIKKSVEAAENITDSLLKVHEEVDKVLEGAVSYTHLTLPTKA